MFQNHKPHRRLQLFFAGATATLRLVTVCQDRYSDLRDDPNGIRRLLEVDAEDYAGQVLAQKEEKTGLFPKMQLQRSTTRWDLLVAPHGECQHEECSS